MAKKKLTNDELIAAYKELDKLVEIEPAIEYKKLEQDAFEMQLHDAYVEYLEIADEDDEFSKETESVFTALIEKYGNEVIGEVEEEEEEDIPDVEDEEEELEEEEEIEPEPEPKPVKEEKPKTGKKGKSTPKEKPKKEKAEKKEIENPYRRVDALIDALDLEPETMDEWVESAEKLFKKNEGKESSFSNANLSVEFLVKLNKKFKMGVVPID